MKRLKLTHILGHGVYYISAVSPRLRSSNLHAFVGSLKRVHNCVRFGTI